MVLPQGLSAKRTHLPVQETLVWSLGQDDPLEKEMATHSSILAWEIPQTEEPCGQQSMASPRVRYYWAQDNLLFLIENFSSIPPQEHQNTWKTARINLPGPLEDIYSNKANA